MKRIISFILTLALVLGIGVQTVFAATPFVDVPANAWYADCVNTLREFNVINGYGGNRFGPDDNLTRGQFATIICNAYLQDQMTDLTSLSKSQPKFKDVPAGAYYEIPVRVLQYLGVVNGIGNNLYGSDNSITRQDATVMTQNLLKLNKPESEPTNTGYNTKFSDNSNIATYAREAVGKFTDLGIISGMGNNTFAPRNPITRAQAARITVGTIENLYESKSSKVNVDSHLKPRYDSILLKPASTDKYYQRAKLDSFDLDITKLDNIKTNLNTGKSLHEFYVTTIAQFSSLEELNKFDYRNKIGQAFGVNISQKDIIYDNNSIFADNKTPIEISKILNLSYVDYKDLEEVFLVSFVNDICKSDFKVNNKGDSLTELDFQFRDLKFFKTNYMTKGNEFEVCFYTFALSEYATKEYKANLSSDTNYHTISILKNNTTGKLRENGAYWVMRGAPVSYLYDQLTTLFGEKLARINYNEFDNLNNYLKPFEGENKQHSKMQYKNYSDKSRGPTLTRVLPKTTNRYYVSNTIHTTDIIFYPYNNGISPSGRIGVNAINERNIWDQSKEPFITWTIYNNGIMDMDPIFLDNYIIIKDTQNCSIRAIGVNQWFNTIP